MTPCADLSGCVALAVDGEQVCAVHRRHPDLRPILFPQHDTRSRFVGTGHGLGKYVPPRLYATPWTDEPHWTDRYGPPSDAKSIEMATWRS